jgi:tetratricopeptide (TPR) repeat protein
MKRSAINRQPRRWPFVVLIALSLAAFAILSYTAAITKSPTFDEPLHAVAGAVHRQVHDYRIDIEDPPLWLYWAELPNWNRPLKLDLSSPNWTTMTRSGENEWQFTIDTLYHTPENDGETFIRRCRPMQVAIGVAVGCVLAAFAWQIGGALAGLIAVVLFAFDPTFLAHSAQIKNDVPVTLVTIALTWTLWRLGQRASIYTIAAFAIASALTLTVKFSGILLIPIASALLIIRAFMPFEWPVLGRILATRPSRLGASIMLIAVMVMSAYVAVWASYGFRFRASTDGEPIDTNRLLLNASAFRIGLDVPNAGGPPIAEQASKNISDDGLTHLARFALQHELMPEAWLNGLLFVNEYSKARPAFLCGQRSTTGWWYYFPLAVLFKAPLATLLAGAALVVGFFTAPKFYARQARRYLSSSGAWTAATIAVPFSVYALVALSAHINIGIRHILPLFPFGFLLLALGLSRLIQRRRQRGLALAAVLFAILAAETLSAWPNYLAFFNTACDGARGGIHLLSDSNLDWGQDLPLLAKWQRAHPDQKLHLAYFGLVDPEIYGIKFSAFPGHNVSMAPAEFSSGPSYLAISALVLQMSYNNTSLYRELLATEPVEVLGGSIYIYNLWDQPAALNVLGTTLTNSHRYSEAVVALERALQLQPNDAASHANLAVALATNGKTPDAIEHLRTAVRLDSSDINAHKNLGSLLYASGDVQAAATEFEHVVTLQPNDADFQIKLADALSQLGEHSKAVEHYEIAVRLQPKNGQTYARLAKLQATLNQSQQAVANAQRAIEIARSSGQETDASELEEWLKHYQLELQR